MSTEPTFFQKLTTHPKCWKYIETMYQLDKINKMPAESRPVVIEKSKYTYYGYLMKIDRSPYPNKLSGSSDHELRCTEDGKVCLLARYGWSPDQSNFLYCVYRYADKFRYKP